MPEEATALDPIAHIRTEFPTKFGIPRQAGLVDSLRATVVFCPPYRDPEALRGLDGFSHLWLIWEFSQARRQGWSPTVRPPRLGGNARMGVFATRSPFRPNPIGLSCVRLEAVSPSGPEGPTLLVSGADLMDGTPIYDLKPYVPYADCHPEAVGGFAAQAPEGRLTVDVPEDLLARLPEGRREALREVLAQDPRPSYQDDPQRVYGFGFAGAEVRFRVEGGRLIVLDIQERRQAHAGIGDRG
jgi:tRNA-Thr(GGU) m(6)t(6)A37 methyltransferase TsaA